VIICNSGSGKLLPVCALAAVVVATGAAAAFGCVEKYCTKMSGCAEAHHHFTVCGEQERDADNDGIPCENVCGKTLPEYRRLLEKDVPVQPNAGVEPLEPQSGPTTPEKRNDMTPAPEATSQCGGKRKCGQMLSCEEARFYLQSCGVRSLDRDGDGVPCESLCGGR
jgi:hypothetical protein